MSPSVRRAITLFRKKLTLEHEEKVKEEEANTDLSEIIEKGATVSKVDAELARLIEQTYQYIYQVEAKRIMRTTNKVEDLFDSNPMMFDYSQVATQLARQKKMKQDANMLLSHVQIYEE